MLTARRIRRKRVLRITSAACRTSASRCCRCGGPVTKVALANLASRPFRFFFGALWPGETACLVLTIQYLGTTEPDAERLCSQHWCQRGRTGVDGRLMG